MPDDTATLTLPEILAALSALPAESHREAVAALQNDAGPVVKAFRSKVFAAGKAEGGKVPGEAAEALAKAQERVEELETQLAETQAKVPDAAKLEERLKGQWQRKVDAEKAAREKAEQKLGTTLTRTFRSQFGKALRDLKVDPEYADEVLAGRYADRYRVLPDGAVQVLKPGEDSAYEAASEEEAVRLLAADVRQTVKPQWVLSTADGGAGITNGAGGGAVQGKPLKQQEADKRAEIGTLF